MNRIPGISGLSIDSPLVTINSPNSFPPTWPPPNDFPIVIDGNGQIVSRYGDSVWNLTPWARKVVTLNFGDGSNHKDAPGVSFGNADLFRKIVAWWLYGPRNIRTPNTLASRFTVMRGIFVFCTQQGILASELTRYPRVAEQLIKIIRPSVASRTITILHEIWEERELLGDYLLDPGSIKELSRKIDKHEASQTPYIPPRIWKYQLSRLRECLEDFNAHLDQIEQCFVFCLNAYAENAGSLEKACSEWLLPSRRPFQVGYPQVNGAICGATYHGSFRKVTNRFKIEQLLERWTVDLDRNGATAFSTYFNLIGHVGTAYLVNFTLMRIEEAHSLRANCFQSEQDIATSEIIYYLRGTTTKTIEDDDAYWFTSPSVEMAIKAMHCVSKLRMIAANANSKTPINEDERINPFLVLRAYEPWRRQSEYLDLPISARLSTVNYAELATRNPKLFNKDELRITEEDLRIARMITPTLDPKIFDVGKVWPLGWHQLRRTGAVNMSASGVVGDQSLQYQLKHLTRAMSRYYGQGYYHLNIRPNGTARTEYIKAMYQVLAQEFSLLQSDRYVSPHGEKRKAQILNLVSETDHSSLIAAAKSGKIAYREIFLGACTNPHPCPYGGIDYVAQCGGGCGRPSCEHLLIDKQKEPTILKLKNILITRLESALEGSPLSESLQTQIRAVENTLNGLNSA